MVGGRTLGVILMPTLACNAECSYCFVRPGGRAMDLDDVGRLFGLLAEHARQAGLAGLRFYWQGGEATLLGPDWFLRMRDLSSRILGSVTATHNLQSNLLAYGPGWTGVVREVFGGQVSTSLDFPNHHRRLHGSTAEYDRRAMRSIRSAREDGLAVRMISVLGPGSLAVGARRFLEHYVEEAGFRDFQVNLPYYAGRSAGLAPGSRLSIDATVAFVRDLTDLVLEREDVTVGPISTFRDCLRGRRVDGIGCVWSPCCAGDFLCVGPGGEVSICDGWVAGLEDWGLGNVWDTPLSEVLRSPVRRRLMARTRHLMEAPCGECRWLALCHGGCPLRATAMAGRPEVPDPYCPVYRAIFERLDDACRT